MVDEEKQIGEMLFSWQFPERQKQQRNKTWYLGALVLIALLLLYALITANFLFAIIIVIGAITLIIREKYEPEEINFNITENGIKIEDNFYEYEEIKNYHILYQPPEIKNLYFEFKSIFRPRLIIPLERQNPLKIRDTLNQFLEEDLDKENEPLTEAFKKSIKF